jgi:signal peptidase I
MGEKKRGHIRLRTLLLVAFSIVVVTGVIFQGFLMLMVVPSESMEPTIKAGNLLVGVRNPGDIARGDILAFQTQDAVMIKRLIGLPGELVCIMEDGSVMVDGELLDEPYVQNQRTGRRQDFDVPIGSVLFLGDNRASSYDARYWDNPYISLDAVLAEAEYILFPRPSKIHDEGMADYETTEKE